MNKILNNLGLCAASRGVITGEDFVLDAIKNKKVYYLFLANDASINTAKRIKDKAKTYNIEINEDFSTDQLSHAIGKDNRKIIGISNSGFVKILKK
ncbi:MAG: L7Ae/L30e/S12e/Gadd45 family ribosomal protein [Anaeroplasmataceae bacterium]